MTAAATPSQAQPEFLLLAKSTNSGIISQLLSTLSYKKDQVRNALRYKRSFSMPMNRTIMEPTSALICACAPGFY